MQILGKIFNALLFVSAMGGIFCVLSLFAARVLRCALPLWVPLCGMALFCVQSSRRKYPCYRRKGKIGSAGIALPAGYGQAGAGCFCSAILCAPLWQSGR